MRSLFIGHWALGIGNKGAGVAIAIKVKTLYPALTQAFQETAMPKPPGKNSTSWQPAWNNGKTKTIRVPIVLEHHILDYARAVDSKLLTNESTKIPMLIGDFLVIIDRYIAWRTKNYRSTQLFAKPDITARTWDELRKLQQLLRESPKVLRE
ncbi:hypothetical protein NSTCB13_01613 [Nostoc sp. DSM 114160]